MTMADHDLLAGVRAALAVPFVDPVAVSLSNLAVLQLSRATARALERGLAQVAVRERIHG